MVARGREPLESVAEEVRCETGATIHTFLADVGVKEDVESLLDFAQGALLFVNGGRPW
jgi:short-subunit dehydrogenase